MPEITSRQSYELDKQPATAKSQAITHYIHQPTRKSSQADTMATAYSLHMEHYSMRKKREQALKQNGAWRENLNILRTIPRPHEQQLLKTGEHHKNSKHKKKSNTNSSERNKADQHLQQQRHKKQQNGSVKNKSHIVRLSVSAHKDSESRSNHATKELLDSEPSATGAAVVKMAAASLGEILDPQLSSGERYDKYIKDIEKDEELDKDDLASLYSHARSDHNVQEPAETHEAARNIVSSDNELELPHPEKEYTFQVIDTSRFNSRNKDLNNYLSEKVGEVKISSRTPSKAPSRIGRVSSLGLEGRISVTGTHVSEKMTSRMSMASDKDGQTGKGYVLKDGEIPRKVYIPKDEGNLSSRGVERDVKLMQYLTKHSKVTAPMDGSKSEDKKLKPKPVIKSKVFLHGKRPEETEVTEVKGGGFKIIKSASKKKRTGVVDLPLQSLKCEIQTQTDV